MLVGCTLYDTHCPQDINSIYIILAETVSIHSATLVHVLSLVTVPAHCDVEVCKHGHCSIDKNMSGIILELRFDEQNNLIREGSFFSSSISNEVRPE